MVLLTRGSLEVGDPLRDTRLADQAVRVAEEANSLLAIVIVLLF